MPDLIDISSRSRRALSGSRSVDPARQKAAEWARRDDRRLIGLCRTAARMAAAERRRHGKHIDPEDARDAAQTAALFAFRDGRPMAAEFIDPERPTVGTAERVQDRPSRDLIAAAGAALDAALREQHLTLDPEAGSGGMLALSAATRDAAEARHSIAEQVIDPAVSPLSADFESAADAAGLKPGGAERHAAAVAVTGEPDSANPRHPMTSGDWAAVAAPGYGRTRPGTLRERARNGRAALANPKTRPSRERVARFGRMLAQVEAYRREFTRTLDRSAKRGAMLRELSVHPTGGKHSADPLPDRGWRTDPDKIHTDGQAAQWRERPIRNRKRLPNRTRRQVPPSMPDGWRREQAAEREQGPETFGPLRTIAEIHAEHIPAKRPSIRRRRKRSQTMAGVTRPMDIDRRKRAAARWRTIRAAAAPRMAVLIENARRMQPARPKVASRKLRPMQHPTCPALPWHATRQPGARKGD